MARPFFRPGMPTVQVRLHEPRSKGYPIRIEPGLLHRAGAALKPRFKGYAPFIISNPLVFGLWGRALEASLKQAGFAAPIWHLVPDGEKHKTFAEYQRALAALAAWGQGLGQPPLVLLLGGGVIGDLGGFVAATYKRGVPFVQIPTSLLSMVDSSVGGKLGIDFPSRGGLVKNLVGAFAQPEAVLIDPRVLATLEPRQLRSGLGEVVKTAVLFDPKLFATLERRAADLLQGDAALYGAVIAACVAHKARVVGRDEFDRRGERALLNLGHTFGHAVESASKFKLLHGEGVAFGLACAADLSARLGLLERGAEGQMARLRGLLAALGLPLKLKRLPMPAVLAAMAQDKKFEGGARFVLPKRLGNSVVHPLKGLGQAEAVLASRFV
jgi:3-dehydroquinate synthase